MSNFDWVKSLSVEKFVEWLLSDKYIDGQPSKKRIEMMYSDSYGLLIWLKEPYKESEE